MRYAEEGQPTISQTFRLAEEKKRCESEKINQMCLMLQRLVPELRLTFFAQKERLDVQDPHQFIPRFMKEKINMKKANDILINFEDLAAKLHESFQEYEESMRDRIESRYKVFSFKH